MRQPDSQSLRQHRLGKVYVLKQQTKGLTCLSRNLKNNQQTEGRCVSGWQKQGALCQNSRVWFLSPPDSSQSRPFSCSNNHLENRPLSGEGGWVPNIDPLGIWNLDGAQTKVSRVLFLGVAYVSHPLHHTKNCWGKVHVFIRKLHRTEIRTKWLKPPEQLWILPVPWWHLGPALKERQSANKFPSFWNILSWS